MVLKDFKQMVEKLKEVPNKQRIALVAADDKGSLEAIIEAEKDGLVEPVLVGNQENIEKILKDINCTNDYPIYNVIDAKEAAHKAVSLIREDKADFLMKGNIDTAGILSAVVNKETGLGTGSLMTHFAIIEVPNYHKLVVVTDGGMLMYPTMEQKVAVIENAVTTLNSLGYEEPKIGILSAIETVNKNMPETVDADKIKQLNIEGELEGCVVEGPISYDLAMNKGTAEVKNFDSPVAGDVDVLVVPDINTGNILSKSLIYSAGGEMAGIIVGAKVPIVLTSRGSSAEERYLSIALAALSVA